MNNLGVLLAAFVFGGAVGFLNNAVSGWMFRFSTRSAERQGAGPGSVWPSLFGLQFIFRIALSAASLFMTYQVSGGDSATILVNLAGLFAARYFLLWRMSRGGGGDHGHGGLL